MAKILAKFAPRDRWNFDETSFFAFAPPDRGLASVQMSGKKKIMTQFKVKYNEMVQDIQVCIPSRFQKQSITKIFRVCVQNSLGRVSFTSDIWSRQNLEGYMAITAHYAAKSAAGHLVIRSRLIAFRHLEGSHTGFNIGNVFVQVLKEIGCLRRVRSSIYHKLPLFDCSFQVSMITLDNASNNNTGMNQIEDELRALDIPFDSDGNRIR